MRSRRHKASFKEAHTRALLGGRVVKDVRSFGLLRGLPGATVFWST